MKTILEAFSKLVVSNDEGKSKSIWVDGSRKCSLHRVIKTMACTEVVGRWGGVVCFETLDPSEKGQDDY